MDKIDEDYVDLYNVAANKRTTFLHVIYPKSWTPPQHVSPHGGVIGRGNVEKTSDNVALRFSVPCSRGFIWIGIIQFSFLFYFIFFGFGGMDKLGL